MNKYILLLCFISISHLFSQPRGNLIYIDNIILPGDSQFVCYFTYKIPFKNLVFVKEHEFYKSGMELLFETKDENGNYYRKTAKEEIIIEDYHLQESDSNFLEGIVSFELKPEKFIFQPYLSLYNTEDVIPLRQIEVELKNNNAVKLLNPLVVSINSRLCQNKNVLELLNFNNAIPFGDKNAGLLLPVVDTSITRVHIEISQTDSIYYDKMIDSTAFSHLNIFECENRIVFSNEPVNNIRLFLVENLSGKLDEGRFKVKISTNNFSEEYNLLVQWLNKPRSLNNLEFAIEILEYITGDEKIHEILDNDEEDYYQALKSFWKKFDPDKSSPYNEVMNQYYTRVDEAIIRFGNNAERNGALTDMGKIFILYGEPAKKERSYSAKYNVVEIWKYPSLKKEFVFTDNAGVGNYKLFE